MAKEKKKLKENWNKKVNREALTYLQIQQVNHKRLVTSENNIKGKIWENSGSCGNKIEYKWNNFSKECQSVYTTLRIDYLSVQCSPCRCVKISLKCVKVDQIHIILERKFHIDCGKATEIKITQRRPMIHIPVYELQDIANQQISSLPCKIKL